MHLGFKQFYRQYSKRPQDGDIPACKQILDAMSSSSSALSNNITRGYLNLLKLGKMKNPVN